MPEFDLQKLLAQLPASKDGKMPPIDSDLTNDLGHELVDGGRTAVAALLGSLQEIDDGGDWQSRFLLHALAIHVGEPGHDPQKQDFIDSCLAELGGSYPDTVKAFTVTQLRLVAGRQDIPKILPLLDSGDPQIADAAAATLVSIGSAAKKPLEKARGSAKGRAKALIEHSLAQID
jgi:hypothetical protein